MARWHHAPAHCLDESGAYMVTAGTYRKVPFFSGPERLDLLHDAFFQLALEFELRLQAWAIFSNHYHFVAELPGDATRLRKFLQQLHSTTARELNLQDETPQRKVWHQYWDSRITYQRSYFARLQYVHQNPVKHGLTQNAEQYRWCSARWFQEEAPPSLYRTICSFPTDRVRVLDDF
ncbi:MAG: REP-associated tyrosine transposase [Armatimonadota bacterium]